MASLRYGAPRAVGGALQPPAWSPDGGTWDDAAASRGRIDLAPELLVLFGAEKQQTPHVDLLVGQFQAIMALTDDAAPTLVFGRGPSDDDGGGATAVEAAFARLEMTPLVPGDPAARRCAHSRAMSRVASRRRNFTSRTPALR